MKRLLILCGVLAALATSPILAPLAAMQDANGNSTKKGEVKTGARTRTGDGGVIRTPKKCDAGEIIVRCGMPGCVISVDDNQRGISDSTGELRVQVSGGATHTIAVSKPYYESAKMPLHLACGEATPIEMKPKAKLVALRIRTSLPECDIYLNNSPSPLGRSDAQGVFNYQVVPSMLLVEARKKGYLSQTQQVTVVPEGGTREIMLMLEPIKASLSIVSNVEGARARVDGGNETQPASERLFLVPGGHRITVVALGYAPNTFEVDPAPGEKITKPITLERLPVAEIMRQAEASFAQRAYADVLTLCGYIFEADADNAPAHRLIGQTYLAGQDYTRAGAHLEKALAANEIVRLQVRRHSHESFDLVKGHDMCEALLILNKSEVEFQGLRDISENFRVPYSQVEVTGIQLKKNTALYLGTKITIARGKKSEYDFYGFDKELSQTSRPFLEMLQRLLKSH
jgi:hypothetical protein